MNVHTRTVRRAAGGRRADSDPGGEWAETVGAPTSAAHRSCSVCSRTASLRRRSASRKISSR
eukprot:7376070-Prymnesium_polylepis.2